MSLYLSSERLEEKRSKSALLCVVPVITVIIVIHAHQYPSINFNRGWLDRVFLNCGWLDRGEVSAYSFGLATNPTRARSCPLNINPKPDSISGPAGSGRVADLYFTVNR